MPRSNKKLASAIIALSLTCHAQTSPAKPRKQTAPPQQVSTAPQKATGELESVLSQLDKASEGFHSVQADFVWNQYQKVVDETDVQKGSIYFVCNDKDKDKGTQMAADITVPDKKYVVFNDGKLRLYLPKIDQLTEYETTEKNRGDLESFLVLGFGSRGHDLLKAFDTK